MLFAFALLALQGPPSTAPAPAVSIPFRTDATPRIDPVFGDVATLRVAIDGFAVLQYQMDEVRDQFSTAVHETLATLQTSGGTARPMAITTAGKAAHCPVAAADPYARALTAGGRFLSLGRQLQARFRELRRGEDSGDAAGLTPDYRWKARRAREQYGHLLNDYREMRVAFHDQLGAELRHNGCKLGDKATRRPASATNAAAAGADAEVPERIDPYDPSAWTLDPADDASAATTHLPPAPLRSPGDGPAAGLASKSVPPAAVAGSATAIWIDVDNSLCPQPTHVTIDGQAMGDVAERGTASIRTRAGPHELCALPATDARPCGAPGTVRKAYLHEGWSLTVHCGK
ncbi:MAG TPA: hypothetical protein VGL59_13490 [Polyangia bacterium]|jgi:hypothetical protein